MTTARHDVDRRTLVRWRNAIITAFALGGIVMSAFGSRLVSISDRLHATPGALGTILMATTLGSLVGLAIAATVNRRFGAKAGIRFALLVVAVAVGFVGMAVDVLGSQVATALGLALLGFGIGLVDVLMNIEAALVEQAAGRTLMPLFHGMWSAGAIVGTGLSAASAALRLSVLHQFLAEAVLIAVCAIVAAAAIPRHDAAPDEGERQSFADRARGLVHTLADWRLVLIGLVMLGSELGEGSANNWLTLATNREHGQREAVAAAFFMLFAIGETCARVLGGPAVDKVGRPNAVRITSVLGVIGVSLFILTHQPLLVALGIVLWSFGVSMGFPLGFSAAADSGPNPPARVSAVATIGYAANLAGPPLLGHLADAVGLLNALWAVVVLMVVAIVCANAMRQDAAPTA